MSKRLISCRPSSTSCSHAPQCTVYAPLACSSGRYPEYTEPRDTKVTVYAPTVIYNEVTIVNENQTLIVTQPQSDSPAGYHGHRHHRRFSDNARERPPKLARFCQSAGMMDCDLVARMDADEIASESAKCVGYFGREAVGDFGQMIGAACDIAGGICRGIAWLVD